MNQWNSFAVLEYLIRVTPSLSPVLRHMLLLIRCIITLSLLWAERIASLLDSREHGNFTTPTLHVVTDAITTWQYRLSLRTPANKIDDGSCRYCTNTQQGCSCYDDLNVWWEACELAALVLPSSGSAERVFLFAKNLFNDYQSRVLSGQLKLTLLLAFNNRGKAKSLLK